ncbi:protein 5NUC isoform X1 [Drosophila grimshawi]|uniref:protein 5NUC isoform X1 n=2 Tax=Drosophila grimshawi TaxID=7222 RepID=UPI001C932801|nr:protein 5NUC isoform X1 [Drosophila grimshawi]
MGEQAKHLILYGGTLVPTFNFSSKMIAKWRILGIVLLLGNSIAANPIAVKPVVATEFIILHNNDMHARFEQTNANSEKCPPEDVSKDKCFGGFARVAHEVGKYRSDAKNGGTPVFYLNAGDTYTGTAWFTIFKNKIASDFLNKLQPDAMSLGNHEFDEKVEGLIPLLNDVNFPVLACNLDLTNEPEMAATKHLANSTIIETNGTKIAVIGYVTPDTKLLSLKNNVEFKEEIVSINAEAAKLKAQGFKIIIALGHSGYKKDLDIAANCPEVDIVIGGHTNTFLFNGEKPSVESIDGPYPTVVTQKSGKRVPVVQAYAYTKYLGKLHVKFDKDGNLIEFNGSPILLDAAVPQDEEILRLLDQYRVNVTALEESIVGHSKVYLEGRKIACRSVECNMGNLITDAMIFSRVLEDLGGDYWTDAAIALHQGGGIRSSIERKSDGIITQSDLLTVLPFENDLYVTRITGKAIRNALEHAAAVRYKDSDGAFLQVSGIHVVYNPDMPEGHRVVSVEVRCASCLVPMYSSLNDSSYYNVIVPQFIFDGGDGHVMIDASNPVTMRMQKTILEAVHQYLKYHDFVYPAVEGRIVFRGSDDYKSTASSISMMSCVAMMLFSLIVSREF